jgi:hypothetical protein
MAPFMPSQQRLWHIDADRVARGVHLINAADEAHGGWKDSKVAYLHLKGASQLIRGVRRTLDTRSERE